PSSGPPKRAPPMPTVRALTLRARADATARRAGARQRGLDEGDEQGMRAVGPRAQLGMELHADEPRMLGDLHHLDEIASGIASGDREAARDEILAELVVELIPVAVALLDHVGAVGLAGARARGQRAFVQTEAHRAALVAHQLLLGEQIDHFVSGARVELGGVRVGPAHDVARELDHRRLHAEADAEVRHVALARVTRGLDLALDTSLAEATGHENAVGLA